MPAAASPGTAVLDLPSVLRFSDLALEALGSAREEIDALNVYPVPDGDTGTNLYLTFEAAHEAMLDAAGDPGEGDLRVALRAFARGALLGARGSSGVIFSELAGALVGRLCEPDAGDRPAAVFAEALRTAAEAGYAAVGDPVEGTMLTVARAAADAATTAADDPAHRLGHVLGAAAAAGRQALARTPALLDVLAAARVVDAGGRGLCVVLDAAETAVTGRRAMPTQPLLGRHTIPTPLPASTDGADLSADGPSYEVMFLLDAEDQTVPALRGRLAELGDSLVVVGGDGLWNVHVHVDDVGAALEAGIEAGRPHRVRVTHFADQRGRRRSRDPERAGRAVVVVAAGAGLGDLFARAGAHVVAGGPGRRPTTAQVVAAITTTGAAEVVVLPNDRHVVPVAEAAARAAREDSGVRVAVIPTSAQVQGLAALAVHEPGRPFEQDVLEMTSAARHSRSGAVTVATSRAMTTGGPCEPGDVLGVVEGDFVIVGDDLSTVAREVVERLLGGGGELVTLVAGADAGDLAERCAAHLGSTHPTVDVVVYDGGQSRYPLLVGVE